MNVIGTELEKEPYFYLVIDMVSILSNTDVNKILQNFGLQDGKSNPVIYFYENFLNEYDKETRVNRGVFHTPEPVVSYIVKSVDSLLKSEFGIGDGIADTQKIEYNAKHKVKCKTKIRNKVTNRFDKKTTTKEVNVGTECHKVLILDPTCGTGTFLYEIIRYIRSIYLKNNDAGLWSSVVREHLIPRLYGFEILVAPYTIAHFNLLMELKGHDLNYDRSL